MPFSEREIFETLAQLLDDRVQYLATKTDLMEVSEPLKAHLKQHAEQKQVWNKVKFAFFSSLLAVGVSVLTAWLVV